MTILRVGAAALNQTPMDWQRNQKNILDAIHSARKNQVSILCLPELSVTGYGCEDAFHSSSLVENAYQCLEAILPQVQGLILCLGLPIRFRHALFSAAAILAQGKILGFVPKRFLAGDGLHYEPRWFKAWEEGVLSRIEVLGTSYPLGDYCFDFSGVRIGCEICEDGWVANRPGIRLAERGVDLILNPSASHFSFSKFATRQRFVQESSRSLGVGYIYANLLGCEAGRIIYDGGSLVAAQGELLAVGQRFALRDMVLTAADVDLSRIRLGRASSLNYNPQLGPDNLDTLYSEFCFKTVDSPLDQKPEAWEQESNIKEEEFSRSVTLGLFDYLRKSRSQGFVVSLSGGADSSSVTSLVALMVMRLIQDLGFEQTAKALSHIEGIETCSGYAGLITKLLTCVYQRTQYSGAESFRAAKKLCRELKVPFLDLDIEPLVQAYIDLISKATGEKISWESHDIALQNIQARVRGPGPWLLANLKGALLLSTSNRSEVAVGYTTMDGDTCGGLAPLGGIDKVFLRKWLSWMQNEGPLGLGSLPILSLVNAQASTAELKPKEAGQMDEAELMPYSVLDFIERAFVCGKLSPVECLERLILSFGKEYPRSSLEEWVDKFFRLWSKNQWKRERFAPSFHLDDANLDPRSWCRFPILSGQFERELEQISSSPREVSCG
jgi:NAD+ synthase (glutamine-hydrolysing)